MLISDLCHVSFHPEVGQFNIFYIDNKKICCLSYFGPNYEISVKDIKNEKTSRIALHLRFIRGGVLECNRLITFFCVTNH